MASNKKSDYTKKHGYDYQNGPRNEGYTAEKAFKETVHERNLAVPKNVSSKREGLHSYTDKEQQKLSGGVSTFSLSKPITYNQFKKLSSEKQKMYIEHIVSAYPGVTCSEIAIMFGMSGEMIRKTFVKLGIERSNNRRKTKEHVNNCNRFFADYGVATQTGPISIDISAVEEHACEIDSIRITGSDISSIMKKLESIGLKEGKITVTVTVE